MKKLLIASCLMLGFAVAGSAQVTPAKTATKATDSKMKAVKPATTPAKVVKMDKPAATTKPVAVTKPAVTKPATTTGPMTKEGKPDMRFKANKNAKTVPAGPTKKDGTPDMRFKANKTAAKTKGTK